MEKIRPLLPFIILLLLSIAVIILSFLKAHQYGGVNLPLDAEAIIDCSRTVLHDLQIDYAGLQPEIRLKCDRPLVRQMQVHFGIQESNRLLRDSVSGYSWEVQWRKKKSLLTFGTGKNQTEEITNILKGDIQLSFDTRGRIVEFQRKVGDSVHIPSLTSAEAKAFALSFLKRFTAVTNFVGDTASIVSERHIQQPNRNDHEFRWTVRLPALDNKLDIEVAVAGNLVAQYTVNSNVPAEYIKFDTISIIKYVQAILYVLFGIAILIVAFKRIRSYEIGFRIAVLIGVLTAIVYDVVFYLNARGMSGWELVLPLIIVPIFVGGFMIILWAISESIARETWKEKFATVDLISHGYLFHSRLGQNSLRGLALGSAGFALWLLLAMLLNHWYPLWSITTESESLHTFETPIPSLYVLFHSFYENIYVFTFFALFVMSFLYRYMFPAVLVIGMSAATMALLNAGTMGPLVPSLIVNVAVSILLTWSFYKYDALTSFIALFTYGAIQEVCGLFVVDNPVFALSGWILVGFFAVLCTVSVASLFRKKEITDFDVITPAFAKHISERQRMQQELEIARSVQMSFLPKCNPSVPQFDICSQCVPAFEVGGDYYDFIEMGKKLAIAVGDVSGKGTQAAFFMTLTKGFLRALAHVSESPAKILAQVNHHFYENVGRGIFISMIYGVFDTEKKTLTVASAGHNPIIMRKSKAEAIEYVNPPGLALGLDAGEIFEQSIEEVVLKYQPGDLFIFYTDGFTEAKNKNKEEFGEERLSRTVEKLAHGTAVDVMNGIFGEVKAFVGRTQQHDDMTIVVVKVRST